MMNSQERVHATVKGLPVDRVPVFVWLNAHTGAKLMAEYRPSRRRLWNALARYSWKKFINGGAMEAKEIWRTMPLIFDGHTFNWANMYGIDLGADMFFAAHATPWQYANFGYKGGHIAIKDMFGVGRVIGGIYPEQVGPAVTCIEDVANYKFPPVQNEKLYNMFRKARRAYPDVCIAAEIWGPQDFTATSLFGMERFMMFLIDYPEEMHAFFKRWTDSWIEVIRKCARAGADTMAIFDDYGYDQRTLISMPMWKEFTYPHLKRLIDAAHEEGTLALLHSCGYQMPFLDYYVEAGLDVLQSFQPQAGNDFRGAYEKYGDRLTFITGIDIQRGEFMGPQELKNEIVSNYRLAGRKGRHVLGFTHEMQYTMPDANVSMIFDTIKEIQAGRYDN